MHVFPIFLDVFARYTTSNSMVSYKHIWELHCPFVIIVVCLLLLLAMDKHFKNIVKYTLCLNGTNVIGGTTILNKNLRRLFHNEYFLAFFPCAEWDSKISLTECEKNPSFFLQNQYRLQLLLLLLLFKSESK